MTHSIVIADTWLKSGYLHIKNFFSKQRHDQIRRWVDDIIDWQDTPGKWMKYYEPAPQDKSRKKLCRIENFLAYHKGLKQLALERRLHDLLENLLDEPAILFKEKINFKFPGGHGFGAHQDAPAFSSFNQDYHVSVLIAVDDFLPQSGCLEIVKHANKKLLAMAPDKTIDPQVEASLDWQLLPCKRGDIVVFDSYLPHRSGPNVASFPRRGLFFTFNKASAGDYHDQYYALKRKTFPQDCERKPGVNYDSGVFNVANPIM